MREHVSVIMDRSISSLEGRLTANNKHVISTESLREMIIRRVDCSDEDRDREYLLKVGLAQVMQSRLWAAGYRSVRKGYFVNLDQCTNIPYLNALLRNEDLLISDKQKVKEKIALLMKKRQGGQCELIFQGKEIIGITNPPSEEEFLQMIEADAV